MAATELEVSPRQLIDKAGGFPAVLYTLRDIALGLAGEHGDARQDERQVIMLEEVAELLGRAGDRAAGIIRLYRK
jgi:hypothetical protein